MGCCLSSTATDKPPAHNHRPHFQTSDDSRAPPPLDEETVVKEVLSETSTPKPKLLQDPVFQDQKTISTQSPQVPVKLDLEQKDKNRVLVEQPQQHTWEKRVEISEDALSEICSLQSESVSATRDEDDEVQLVNSNNRVSPRKLQKNPRDGFGPGRSVGMSPTRRTDSSPGRRYNGARSARSAQPVGGRRVGLRTEPNRRDPGDSSGRRSRSPATRVTDNNGGANVGRSPSANRRYPGRVPVESSNSSTRRIAEEPKPGEGKWAANESLDNPLVSLECFIFL